MNWKRLGGVLALVVSILLMALGGLFASRLVRHGNGVARAEAAWERANPPPIGSFGTTTSLRVLPLVNWHTADDALQTGMGVSYLVETDDRRILFDLGPNADPDTPSPLQHNLAALDIDPASIDTIVISHDHFDHTGRALGDDAGVLSMGTEHVDLSEHAIYVPVPMTYPGADPIPTPQPKVLGEGIATTGTIPRQLFMGPIDEQAVAIDVEGRGLVLLVGCGHQTLPKILERTEHLFDAPLYGVIGDLHYPVPEGRIQMLGLNMQRLMASGRGPLDPLDMATVEANLDLLEEREPGLVAVGGHDSSDTVLAMIGERFDAAARPVRVGEWIEVAP